MDLLRTVQIGATAIKFAAMARRAEQGDLDATAYILRDSWRELADTAVGYGTSDAITAVARQVHDGWSLLNGQEPDVGFAREVAPWSSWLKWKLKRPDSANLVIGQTGSGKTVVATQMAIRHAEATGYPIEFLNYYPRDIPKGIGATIISDEVLVNRLERVKKALKDIMPDVDEVLDGEISEREGRLDGWSADELAEEIDRRMREFPFYGRCICMDEMGLSDDNPNSPIRRAMKRALTQSRHLSWHTFYIGQQLGQFPRSLIGQSTVIVKKPTGREADVDRQEPFVRHLWRRAAEAFAHVREEPQWSHYPDERAWSYVEAPAWADFRGYLGLSPNSLPNKHREPAPTQEVAVATT